MTRNLKALIVAGLALVAFGSMATSAFAVPEFTAPGAPDGSTTTIDSEKDELNPPVGTSGPKTAHQVFDIDKAGGGGLLSITCNEAFATNAHIIGSTALEVTSTVDFRASSASPNCSFAGQNTVVVNNGNCDFLFTATGELHLKDHGSLSAPNKCALGEKPIVFENSEIKCKVEVGAQTIKGINYKNISVGGVEAITLEATNLGIEYSSSGAGCAYGKTTNGVFTTGNTILRGTRPAGTYVAIKWDA